MSDEMQSATIGALGKALSLAQGAMEGAKKDSENPHFRSKYADLASVWAACRAPLAANGLAVVQTTVPEPGGVLVITTLVHESGEWIRGRLFMPAAKQDAQGFGSACTYARRFALAAIVGIAPEDDDANAAAVPRGNHGPIKAPPTRAQLADKLPQQLSESIEVLELAEKVRRSLASAPTMGDLRETWLDYSENVDVAGWPKRLTDGILLAKNTRKLQLSNETRGAAE